MSELLPCLEVEPTQAQSLRPAAASASVIWLHGLGADGHDFEPVVPLLRTRGVRFVFPHAPALAVTINGGMTMPAWYDIRTLDFDDDAREDTAQIEVSARRIAALVARERNRGIASDRIVLAGFSQGAAMAVHTAVREPETLGGIMVLSGYLLVPERLDAERTAANRATPVLACHGSYDDVVPLTAGRQCHAALARTGAPGTSCEWQQYPMGHEVCPEELERIGAWLRERLGD